MKEFQIRIPQKVVFGTDKIRTLADEISVFGDRVLLLTGMYSLFKGEYKDILFQMLDAAGIAYTVQKIEREPATESLCALVEKYRQSSFDAIVAVGGGSVIDTAKALSVLLKGKGDIHSLLYINPSESKESIPLIAVPTNAGSGSEMNAVCVLLDSDKRKVVEWRNPGLMADVALIDPNLSMSCSYPVTLYSAMQAFCQLIEAYTSRDANPFNDALMLEGISNIVQNLYKACAEGEEQRHIRSHLSYSAMLSGIGMGNSSMTVIHGFSYAIKSMYQIPHAAICASLAFAATLTNMQRVQMFDPDSLTTEKFARIGSVLSGKEYSYDKHSVLLRSVTQCLENLRQELKIPTLSQLGVDKKDFYTIVSKTELFGNPVKLAETELMDILNTSY